MWAETSATINSTTASRAIRTRSDVECHQVFPSGSSESPYTSERRRREFPVIILLAILTSRFLLFPHLGFLFSVRWPLADIAYLFLLCGLMLAFSVLSCSLPANFNSLVASEFLLLVGLYSQHTAHGTLSCSLVAAHCSP